VRRASIEGTGKAPAVSSAYYRPQGGGNPHC
jgi:hypothetical protein